MTTLAQATQWIFDNAVSIDIDGRPTTAQTATRTNVVRTVSRGGRVWRFTVSPQPVALASSSARSYAYLMDQQSRITAASVTLAHHPDIVGYQGSGTGSFSIVVPSGTGQTTVTVTAATLPSGYVCRAGDFLQIGSTGSVYQVVEDPATGNGATVRLNRPVDEAAGTYTGYFGVNVTWSVKCIQKPGYVFESGPGSALLRWDGDFVFIEDRT